MSDVLNLSNVGCSYAGHAVLGGVDLSLQTGERLAVIGSSGSGKTTLLRLIAGLETLSTGEISIAGKVVSRAGELLTAPEHRQVAMVFQGLALFPHLRALDQIIFAAKGRGGSADARRLLDRIGLGHRADSRLDELSGGERQRIALARAIAQRPQLILMDEPFSSLDDEKRAEMRNLLRQLLESSDTTLILVTHSRDDALDLARRVLVLDRGQPVVHGTLESVLTHPQHDAAVRAFALGQVIQGQFIEGGNIATIFGMLSVKASDRTGAARALIRPVQPKIVPVGEGITARIVRIEIRPSETVTVRRTALAVVGESHLRIILDNQQVSPGDYVGIRIEGVCELIES